MDRSKQEVVGRHDLCQFYAFREVFTGFFEEGINAGVYFRGITSGGLEYQTTNARMSVQLTYIRVAVNAQFDIGNVFQLQHFAVFRASYHDFAELFGCLLTAFVLHGVLVGLFGVLSERTRSRFDVLFGQCIDDIRRDELVLRHDIGFHPHTHGVVTPQHNQLANPFQTKDFGFQVDTDVVTQKFFVVAVVGAAQGKYLKHGVLTLDGRYTHLGYFGRKLTGSHCHTILHVHRRHVGIGSLTEVHHDFHRTGIGRGRSHVGHVFHPVDSFFQRGDYTLLKGFGTGTVIVGHDHDGRRCNVGILFYRQRLQANQPHNNNTDGDDGR